MAASLTHTTSNYAGGPLILVHTLDWTSHTDGVVDLDTNPIYGELQRVTFVPDSGGTAPSAAYDVLLKDADGIDVLAGQGANLSETTATHIRPGVPFKDGVTTSTSPITIAGVLNLEVSNAGSEKGGLIRLVVR